jgi:hypothetical protein
MPTIPLTFPLYERAKSHDWIEKIKGHARVVGQAADGFWIESDVELPYHADAGPVALLSTPLDPNKGEFWGLSVLEKNDTKRPYLYKIRFEPPPRVVDLASLEGS